MPDLFVVDLDAKPLEVRLLPSEAVLEDLAAYGATHWTELIDNDWKLFKTLTEAENWLEKFTRMRDGLDNAKIKKASGVPCMLYKRKYITLTLMREKLRTFRHYRKNWKPGQLFNLHDQTFFLTVRLLEITPCEHGYRYDFELA